MGFVLHALMMNNYYSHFIASKQESKHAWTLLMISMKNYPEILKIIIQVPNVSEDFNLNRNSTQNYPRTSITVEYSTANRVN